MAELVEFQKERALAEYEQMEALNLFSNEEIVNMKKTRESYEYRITQPSRALRDYLEYIKYERKLIALTKDRSKIDKIKTNNTIQTMIITRMKRLYNQALSKFPEKTRFWDEYIKFLQQFKFQSEISLAFDKMLQFHSNKANVWIRAILWEYNENFEEQRVKGLLLRAQQRHPESKHIYLIFFQIELENKSESNEASALQKAGVVYSTAQNKFRDNVDIFIEMLRIADKFPYAKPMQQTIADDMRRTFSNMEILWHTLAQRELHGLQTDNFTFNIKKEEDGDEKPKIKKIKCELNEDQPPLKKRVEVCIQIYEEAVKALDTQKMWNYYISAMTKLNADLTTHSALKRFALARAYQTATESDRMSEDHYLQYIELLYSNNAAREKTVSICKRATSTYKKSSRLWMQFMGYYIQCNDFPKLQKTFNVAKFEMALQGADLWMLYMVYLRTHKSPATCREFERVLQEIAYQPNPEFNKLKAYILEVTAVTSGMTRAQRVYELFIRYMPDCFEVYEKMADIEEAQMNRDISSERSCLENLVLHFGQARTDVWLRYMRFEQTVGDPGLVSRLYTRAVTTLDPKLLDDFISMYNFFSNGVA